MESRKQSKRQTALTLADLRAMGTFPSPTGRRGRPRKNSVSALNLLQFGAAVEVQRAVERDHRKTGAITRAVTATAKRRGASIAWVRKAWQRHPLARDWGTALHRLQATSDEINQRMLALPSDVVERLKELTPADLLDLLRSEGIDGTAPARFVDGIRGL